MTAPDRRSPLSSYDFFAWLTVTRPPLMEGLFGAPYGVATREVADRVGFRPAGAAETIGHYLAALQAFIAVPPSAPRVVVVPDLRPGEARFLLVGREVPAGTPCEDLPIQFAGPEPVTAAVGDPWPYHLCMPGVEWPAPVDGHELMDASLGGLHGPSIVESVVDHWDRPPVPPFVPAFEVAPDPPRSAVARALAAFYLAAAVRLRSAFSTTAPLP
ncbi:MAG: hypothetical protein K2Q20_15075 [Phycisphaerales bacterium]|nr:hypothetical protein [Phycisphaerales bacterium]